MPASDKAPSVSVIVPIYNVGPYVAECIASLRAQTWEDFEAVCVDDGSTDDSAARAREAAGGDGRFTFVVRENGGLSAARNTGLDAARGEYVAFLDSDDCYEPAALSRLMGVAVADGLDLLDFSASTFYESDAVRDALQDEYSFRQPVDGVRTGQELFAEYVRRGQYVPSACMHVVRRSLLDGARLRFAEGLLHEDELFSPLLYAHAERAAFLCEPLYRRRMRADSIMTARRTVRNVDSVFRISQQLHAWIVEHADSCSPEFADAFTCNMAHMDYLAYRYAQEVGEDGMAAYLDSLGMQDRIAFDLSCRYACKHAAEALDDVESSRAYRMARALGDLAGKIRRR